MQYIKLHVALILNANIIDLQVTPWKFYPTYSWSCLKYVIQQ